LLTSYFYLRGNETEWPPTGAAQAPLWLTLSVVLVLLASCVPVWVAFRAALEGRLRPIQLGMLWGTILSAVALALRAYELAAIGYQWNSHAYGSIVWALYFMHTFHLASGVVENLVMTALLYKGPVEKKHMVDLRLSSIYWWFVALSWMVIWAIVMFDDLLFRNTFVS